MRDRGKGGDRNTRRKRKPEPKGLFGVTAGVEKQAERKRHEDPHVTSSSRPQRARPVRVRVKRPEPPKQGSLFGVRTGVQKQARKEIARRHKEAPDERAHRQVKEAEASRPRPTRAQSEANAYRRQIRQREKQFKDQGLRTGRSSAMPLLHAADTAVELVVGAKASEMPGTFAGNLPFTSSHARKSSRQDRIQRQIVQAIREGDTAKAEALQSEIEEHGVIPWGPFGKGLYRELSVAKQSTKAAKAARRQSKIAQRIDRELPKSPVRAQAHKHFDETSPTPEAAAAQKQLYDQQIHDLAQKVAHRPAAVRQIVDHLKGKSPRPQRAAAPRVAKPALKSDDVLGRAARDAEPDLPAVDRELGDLHFMYQMHPIEVPAMPARIRGGKQAQMVYKLVRQGAAWRDWYQRASWVVALTAKREGVTYDQMAQIVAITSQGANPTFNLRLAIEAIDSYKRFGQVKIGPKDPYIFDPEEVEAVLKGGSWEGRKRSSFYQNITQDTDHVTVDRHIAQMLFKTDSPSEKQYQQAEAIFRDIAAQVGWLPKEVQAAAWVPWKAGASARKVAKKGATPKTLETYMETAGDAYEKGLRALYVPKKGKKLKTSELNTIKLGYERAAGQDLEGLPSSVKFKGEEIPVRSNAVAQGIAEDYMREVGLPYHPPRTYAKVDKERAKRIADWYDEAVDAPNDPAVRASYDAMARETLAQYEHITRAGYKFEFYPEGVDPYPGGPREAMLDLQQNRHMYVFPTESGFGTLAEGAASHPLLELSGLEWGGRSVTHNDVFRAVHDFFGHFKEGVGFRADGEENAWRAHSAMYSDEARPAMTAETRGQNSWVNFGPHGEKNRTAMQADTVYADQKAVLAPEWVVREGAGDAQTAAPAELPPREPSGLSFADDASEALTEAQSAARDIARILPEEEWPAWVRNQIRTQAVGPETPIELPNPPNPLDVDRGPTQRYMEHLVGEKFPDVIPDSWTTKFGSLSGEGLGVGFPLGFWDDTEHGLIPALLNKIRGKGKKAEEAVEEAPPTPEQEASGKVIEGLKGSVKARRETEALRSEERGRRIEAAQEAMDLEEGLEASLAAAKEHLKGTLPRVEHNGLRGLDEDEVDLLSAIAKEHPDLTGWDKVRVMDALRNAWLGGINPTRSEYELLKKTYGHQFVEVAFERSRLAKIRHAGYELASLPRSLMASFDVSAPFRQGLVAFGRHPVMTARNLRPMFRYLTSEKGYRQFMEELENAADYDEMMRNGLAITDVEHALGRREEQFQSKLAETITGGKFGPVRASGRAYTGFLVKTRVDMYRHLRGVAEKQGVELGRQGLKDLAGYINAATGRGNMGALEGAAVALNTVFFSPRLIASRVSFLNPQAYTKLHPFVRRQKVRALVQTAGGIASALWLASLVSGVKVELDPTKSDFAKIRIGNTRIDLAGGFSQYIRLISTIAKETVGAGEGKTDDAIVRFVRGKLSPVVTLATNIATRTDYAGFPVEDWKKEVYDSFIPLVIQNVRDMWHQTGSLPAAGATAVGAGVGLGVQSYGDVKSEAEKAKEKKPKRGSMEEAKEWESEAEETFGYIPPEIARAKETKALYHEYQKEWKKENEISDMTDYQLMQAKIHILAGENMKLANQMEGYLKEAEGDEEMLKIIDRYIEKSLAWDQVDIYNEQLSKAKKLEEALGG